MIRPFRHKDLEAFFRKGTRAGIQPAHAGRVRRQLAKPDTASSAQDMDLPGWHLHPLSGGVRGHWSVRVSGNWRLIFTFRGEDAELVDYRDYY